MVIWPAFRMRQYRVNDHPYHAPQFSIFCSPIISGAENGFRLRVTSLMRFMIISYLRHVTDYVRLGYVHLVLIHFQKLKI